MSVAIRAMSAGDVDQVLQLERETKAAAHWTRFTYQEMLSSSRGGALRKFALVAETDGRVIGFIAGSVVAGEAELENIFVAPEFHRQGVARELLQGLANDCRAAGAVKVRLEVRAGNHAARDFYERAGFTITGHRSKYYLDPEEDALLMTLQL